ncbi:MAG TPA: hypothetical protein VFR37_01345 [Longimicrobium sp.]|nr:hypothetical protein [Longimicrobium sp.]
MSPAMPAAPEPAQRRKIPLVDDAATTGESGFDRGGSDCVTRPLDGMGLLSRGRSFPGR